MPSLRAKLTTGFIGLLVIAGLIVAYGISALNQPRSNSNTAVDDTNARELYAALYEAGWRQDQGIGNILMTATLLLPETIVALGQDTRRSDIEDQLYRAVRDLEPNQLAILINTESTIGPLAGDVIKDSLNLISEPTQEWSLVDWQSLIVPTAAPQNDIQTTPQRGVAVFSATSNIAWGALNLLTLVSTNVGDQPERSFTWVNPSVLSEVEADDPE